MSLVELIKQISNDAIKASKPVEVVTGSVLSVSPFKVKIDQKLILSETHLTGDYISANYAIGDKVTMLREQGGKKYHVLVGKVSGGGLNIEYDPENEELILES